MLCTAACVNAIVMNTRQRQRVHKARPAPSTADDAAVFDAKLRRDLASYEAARVISRLEQGDSARRAPLISAQKNALLQRAPSAILAICGVEQLVARRAHNPEVAGSSPVPATSRVVANSSLSANARTTRPPDEHHGGASFVLCAGISRRCQRVDHRGACLCLPWTSPAGRSTAPARRPKSASVSPSLSLCGCSVTAGQSTTAVPSSTDAPWRRHHPLWRAPQA